MSEFPPNLDDGELWLPSNVLGSDDDDEGENLPLPPISTKSDHRGGPTQESMASQNASTGSSPSCSEGERGSDAWDSLDMKMKWNEVNWNWDWNPDSSTWASKKWNSAQTAENPATLATQKPCPVQAGCSQETKPKQGGSTKTTGERVFPVWVPVHGGGSGMKAIFLDSNKSGSGIKSGGTGVFLPRRSAHGFDSKKKKKAGCSTVLLPYRVVQALNLNIQSMGSQPTVIDLNSWKHGSGRKQVDNVKPLPKNGCCEQQKKHFYPVNSNIQPLSPEIRLPPEWTY